MRFSGLWWWIDRWRKSTAYMDMTLEAQGAYRNLLDEATLRGGPLPNNERILAKACGDVRAWRRVRPVVMARFTLGADGWHNETLDLILAESARRAERQRAYRNGGHNAGHNGDHNGSHNAPHNGGHNDRRPPDPDPDLSTTPYSPPSRGTKKPRRRKDITGGATCPHTPRCHSTAACIERSTS